MAYISNTTTLNPKKQKFADNIIANRVETGKDERIKALINAGYMQGRDMTTERNKGMAARMAGELLKEPAVDAYIKANTPLEVVKDVKVEDIVERMYLILGGNVSVQQFNHKGEMYYCPPSFRDQIEAGKLLMNIAKMKEKDVTAPDMVGIISERVEKLTDSIHTIAVPNSDSYEDEEETLVTEPSGEVGNDGK